MLSEKLDVLLCAVSRLFDFLGGLLGTVGHLLVLGLDLLVKSFEDRQNGAFQGLLGLRIGVDHCLVEVRFVRLHTISKGVELPGYQTYLCVDAHVLEEASHASEVLVEVGSFLEGVGDGLEDLLVLLGVGFVDLLGGRNVILQVADSVFPRLESLGEEAGGL